MVPVRTVYYIIVLILTRTVQVVHIFAFVMLWCSVRLRVYHHRPPDALYKVEHREDKREIRSNQSPITRVFYA
jgi:hypothetical protein